ncbi:hypothetical protein IWW38_001293 [Coemansia aciculifera]|uniref:Uncharacterized protein n=1 Tax=Coemansia aciculifera TaxID=417176 RepID=A0ACC1M7D8_9FUNG|nr:hypothetical protein IWW38_001293 [Coemansia aciculifera]
MLADNSVSPADEQTTLTLCASDKAVHLLVMAPLYFEKPSGTPTCTEFMDFDILTASFHRTLATCLPHALGTNLRESTTAAVGDMSTTMLVTVNRASPTFPVVTKHVDSECTVAMMRASGFLPHVQPRAILDKTAQFVSNPMAGDPLVSLDIVYMSDGVGMLLVVSHGVVDMAAYCRFVYEWGLVASAMQGESVAGGVPRELDTDRRKFWAMVSEHTSSLNPLPIKEHFEELSKAGVTVAAGAVGATVFRLSADVAAMKKLASTRDEQCPGTTVPNFVSALLWRLIARAASPTTEFTYFSASLTIRSNPQFAEYWGNTATAKHIHAPTKAVRGEDMRYAAGLVEQCVRQFSVSDFAHIIGLFTSKDSTYVRNVGTYVGAPTAATLSVVNMSRIPFYGVNFGCGEPVKAFYQTIRMPGLCFIMPRSEEGGIEVFVCLTDAAARELAEDDVVQSHFVVEAAQ